MARNPGRDLRHFPEWLHHELLNWSRWCWLGAWPHPLPPSHCGSVERDYTRFRVDACANEPRPIPPIESRALIVDRVWRGLRLGDYEAALCVAIGRVWDAFEGRK